MRINRDGFTWWVFIALAAMGASCNQDTATTGGTDELASVHRNLCENILNEAVGTTLKTVAKSGITDLCDDVDGEAGSMCEVLIGGPEDLIGDIAVQRSLPASESPVQRRSTRY